MRMTRYNRLRHTISILVTNLYCCTKYLYDLWNSSSGRKPWPRSRESPYNHHFFQAQPHFDIHGAPHYQNKCQFNRGYLTYIRSLLFEITIITPFYKKENPLVIIEATVNRYST